MRAHAHGGRSARPCNRGSGRPGCRTARLRPGSALVTLCASRSTCMGRFQSGSPVRFGTLALPDRTGAPTACPAVSRSWLARRQGTACLPTRQHHDRLLTRRPGRGARPRPHLSGPPDQIAEADQADRQELRRVRRAKNAHYLNPQPPRWQAGNRDAAVRAQHGNSADEPGEAIPPGWHPDDGHEHVTGCWGKWPS
jgi:hypothetical protein